MSQKDLWTTEPGSMWTNPPHIYSTTKSTCKPSSLLPRHPCASTLFLLFYQQPTHSRYDIYPSFPLSLSLSPTLFFILCSPSRRCALRRRAGCRRQTGPWRRRWTGRPQAPWQTTPGRCSWRGASPLLSGSGSNPQPQLSPPGGRSKEGRKKNNQQQHRTKRSTQQSQSQYKELQVVHAFLLMEVSPRLFCSQITSAILKACFAMLNSSLVQ